MDSKVKALFFAQYLNQEVYQHDDWKEFNDKSCKELDPTYLQTGSNRLNGGYLVLRGVEQLTDDEAMTIAKIYDDECEWIVDSESKGCVVLKSPIETMWVWKDYSEPIFEVEDKEGSVTSYRINYAYAYLQAIGILLPFTYLDENKNPVTLSPEQIIELGWVKINS